MKCDGLAAGHQRIDRDPVKDSRSECLAPLPFWGEGRGERGEGRGERGETHGREAKDWSDQGAEHPGVRAMRIRSVRRMGQVFKIQNCLGQFCILNT